MNASAIERLIGPSIAFTLRTNWIYLRRSFCDWSNYGQRTCDCWSAKMYCGKWNV